MNDFILYFLLFNKKILIMDYIRKISIFIYLYLFTKSTSSWFPDDINLLMKSSFSGW